MEQHLMGMGKSLAANFRKPAAVTTTINRKNSAFSPSTVSKNPWNSAASRDVAPIGFPFGRPQPLPCPLQVLP